MVDFSADSSICEGNTVSLKNNTVLDSGIISKYLWKFGNGDTSSNSNPVYKYQSPGNYTITLYATTYNSCTDSISKSITVYPRAEVKFSAQDNCANEPLNFTNSTSISHGKVNYLWNFGDGTTSTDSLPTKAFSTAGIYDITLYVTSNFGCTDSASQTITIYPLPKASFTVKNYCIDSAVQFVNNTSISVGTVSYIWQFGDGNSSVNASPSHIYAQPGTYTVKLIAISNNGCKDSTSQNVTIYTKPKAAFGFNGDFCLGGTINFKDSSTITSGIITSYEWDFGDGNKSTNQNPTHTYASAGTYEVKLTVKSNFGCTDFIAKQVTVNALPDLFINDTIYERNVKFVVSDSSYSTYNWSFGDGDSSTDKNPLHRYPATGTYKITLLVTNLFGCEKTFTDSVQILTNNIKHAELQRSINLDVYPNPFNEYFIFGYSVNQPTSVKATIVDITGKEIVNIINVANKPAGTYTELISAKDYQLKAGIYFLRVTMKDKIVTRKIIRVE